MDRLTDAARGYCEKYCENYGVPGCSPESCGMKAEVSIYEGLRRLENIVLYDRLLELAEADRDERIIVLPKKATLISAVCQNKDGIYLMNHMGVYEVNSEVRHEPKK